MMTYKGPAGSSVNKKNNQRTTITIDTYNTQSELYLTFSPNPDLTNYPHCVTLLMTARLVKS